MGSHTVFMGWKTQRKDVSPPQLSYKFNTIAIKIPARFFFVDTEKIIILDVDRKAKELHTAGKAVLKRKNNVGGISWPDFKTYYKDWYWRKDKHIDQWNRMQNPERDPYRYAQLIFTKVWKQFSGGKESLFSTSWYQNNWTSTGGKKKKKNLSLSLTFYIKFNSKSITDLNVKLYIIIQLSEKTQKKTFGT